ncbi:anti-sigma factor family protein [Nannocystaceae bacterium ST9]
MTLDTDHDRNDLVGLLQPYVDGELSPEEHRLIAERVAVDPEYQAIVGEQQRVRSLLREMALEGAPSGLRARILADLDAVDRERERAERRGWMAPVLGRLRAFGKGTMLMMPAAAAALALFVVARNGQLDGIGGAHVDGGLGQSFALQQQGGDEADRFPIQLAAEGSLPAGVQQVSAATDSRAINYRDAEGRVMVDRQRRAAMTEPTGTRQVFRGHTYYLGLDGRGRARVEFVLGPVHHHLTVEQGHTPIAAIDAAEPDFRRLLELGEALRR